jgi:hypothetical protein
VSIGFGEANPPSTTLTTVEKQLSGDTALILLGFHCRRTKAVLGCLLFFPQTITYIRHDDTLTCIAHMLGHELRNCENKLVSNGRNTNTSNSVEHYSNSFATEVQLMPHQHSCANFFCGTHADLTKLMG